MCSASGRCLRLAALHPIGRPARGMLTVRRRRPPQVQLSREAVRVVTSIPPERLVYIFDELQAPPSILAEIGGR